MTSLLFFLFLVAMVLTVVNNQPFSLAMFGVAMVLTGYWFNHHMTNTLDILL
jgi:hypothetical protein